MVDGSVADNLSDPMNAADQPRAVSRSVLARQLECLPEFTGIRPGGIFGTLVVTIASHILVGGNVTPDLLIERPDLLGSRHNRCRQDRFKHRHTIDHWCAHWRILLRLTRWRCR